MRKLTPEERAIKNALSHVHDENCGHSVAETPVAEETPAQEASAPAEEASAEEAKPKKKKKSEEATVAEEA